MEKLKKLNKAIEPYYALLTMIIFFSALFVSAYKYVITPTDLKISITNEIVNYPSTIASDFEKIYHHLANSKDSLDKKLIPEANQVFSFLVQTRDFKRINFKNIGKQTLHNVKFKYLNVDELSNYSISSDYCTTSEIDEFYKNIVFDKSRKMVYLNNKFEIPANSMISLSFWGNFKESILDHDLLISYDDGEAFVEKEYLIAGFKGYVINYYFEIILLLILIFSLVYHVGLKYQRKSNDTKTTA